MYDELEEIVNCTIIEYGLLLLFYYSSFMSCGGFEFAFEQTLSQIDELAKKRRRIVAGEIRRHRFRLLCTWRDDASK
jgi:hypothetical protein